MSALKTVTSFFTLTAAAAAAMAASPRVPPRATPRIADRMVRIERPVSDYDICLVYATGRYGCVRKQQLRERLGSLTADERDLITGVVDRLNASVGNTRGSDILAHCMSGWHGVRAPATAASRGPAAPGRPDRSALERRLEKARVQALRSACTEGTPAAGRGAPGPSDPAFDQQREAAVAGFDAAMSSCRDSGSSPVAARTDDFGDSQAKLDIDLKLREIREQERAKILRDHGEALYRDELQKGRVIVSQPIVTQPLDPLLPLLAALADLSAKAAQAAREAEQRQAARDRAAELEALEKAEAAAAAPAPTVAPTPAGGEPATPTPPPAQAPTPTPEPTEEDEEQKCLEDAKCSEPDAMPAPPGEPGMSCADKQARWNAFKERCGRSGWRSYECVAFVRMLNGCVDMTRILPGPDGDLTCPVSRSESERQEAAAQKQCEKIGMIGRLSPDGGYHCGGMPVAAPGRAIDLCRDPRIVPDPDRCP